ncbi:hypothetical protein STEG23_024189 [Scotinomys teguina]
MKCPKSLDYKISHNPTAPHHGISKVYSRYGRATSKLDVCRKLHCELEESERRTLAHGSLKGDPSLIGLLNETSLPCDMIENCISNENKRYLVAENIIRGANKYDELPIT